jgi:hypothetical protein
VFGPGDLHAGAGTLMADVDLNLFVPQGFKGSAEEGMPFLDGRLIFYDS